MKRHLVLGGAVGFVCMAITAPRFAHACCEPQQVSVYVHGRYANANPGDVIVNYLTATTAIAPIIEAIGENYSHSMLLFRSAGGEVFHNVGDPNGITLRANRRVRDSHGLRRATGALGERPAADVDRRGRSVSRGGPRQRRRRRRSVSACVVPLGFRRWIVEGHDQRAGRRSRVPQ